MSNTREPQALDLLLQLRALRKALICLRTRLTLGFKVTGSVRQIRRDIARTLTVLRQQHRL